MIWLTATAFYLVFGAALACVIDSDEMKKPVPYSGAPSVFRLAQIRVALFVLGIFFWAPILAGLAIGRFRQGRKGSNYGS